MSSLQPSITWIKGSLSNPELAIPFVVFGLGRSATELLDRIIALQVVFSKLPVGFLVFFQLWACLAHWKERNVNQVVAARAGLFVPPGFVFCFSLLPKSPDCNVIFSRIPVVNAVTSSLKFCKALGFHRELCSCFGLRTITAQGFILCRVGDCNSLLSLVDAV